MGSFPRPFLTISFSYNRARGGKTMFDSFHLDIMVGLGVPATGAMIFIVRHFWIKTKCFHLMQLRLEQLEKDNAEGKKAHIFLREKISEVSDNQHRIMGKLGIE